MKCAVYSVDVLSWQKFNTIHTANAEPYIVGLRERGITLEGGRNEMKKIIKGAFTKFVTDCQKCGCQFEYELRDVLCSNVTLKLTIPCPDCGFYTPHDFEDGLPSSRKFVEKET